MYVVTQGVSGGRRRRSAGCAVRRWHHDDQDGRAGLKPGRRAVPRWRLGVTRLPVRPDAATLARDGKLGGSSGKYRCRSSPIRLHFRLSRRTKRLQRSSGVPLKSDGHLGAERDARFWSPSASLLGARGDSGSLEK